MMKSLFKGMLAITAASVLFLSCSKDDGGEDINEEELITTLRVTTIESGSGTTSTFTFRDPDGPGGAVPTVFDSIILNASRNYSVSLQFLNESVSPADDITLEVEAESNDHQVYYTSTGASITTLNQNLDGLGLPLGTECTWNTGASGTGTMKITLKHKPGAKSSGDPVSKGETDVEVDFPVRLK
jgi:hypothetical protein